MKYGGFVFPSMDYEKMRKYALKVEELGFDSLHSPDHLIGMNMPPRLLPEDPLLESWTLMTALAVETQKIKIGHVVLCNGFRTIPPLKIIKANRNHGYIFKDFIDFIIRHLQKNRAIGSKVEDYSLLSTAKPHFN